MAERPDPYQVLGDAQNHRGCTVQDELRPLVSLDDKIHFFNSLKQNAPPGMTIDSGAQPDGKGLYFSIEDPFLQNHFGVTADYETTKLNRKNGPNGCAEYHGNERLTTGAHAPVSQIAKNIEAHFDRTHNGGKTDINGEYIAQQLKGLSVNDKLTVFADLKTHNIAAIVSIEGQEIDFKIDSSNQAIKWYEDKVNLTNGTHSEFYQR